MKTLGKWWVGQRSPQNARLQVDYLCKGSFNLEILPYDFVTQRQILINVIVIILVDCVLNLLLNTQKPQYRPQHAKKWSLILAHDSHPIYHAPTYITVPLLGPHQQQYIESTLYNGMQLYNLLWQQGIINGSEWTQGIPHPSIQVEIILGSPKDSLWTSWLQT